MILVLSPTSPGEVVVRFGRMTKSCQSPYTPPVPKLVMKPAFIRPPKGPSSSPKRTWPRVGDAMKAYISSMSAAVFEE
jgi:hypothetical protein